MTQIVKIVRRIRPCTCGCRGRDYWHRASYRRAISGQRPAADLTDITRQGAQELADEEYVAAAAASLTPTEGL